MLTVATAALFLAAATLAIGAIAATMREYGPTALALRDQAATLETLRPFRYRIVEMRRSAEVVALPVRPRTVVPAGLRAAA